MLTPITISCPYCGESFESMLDAEEGETEFIEDCQVCCRPITIIARVGADDEAPELEIRREDD
jgi:hypothetical protein